VARGTTFKPKETKRAVGARLSCANRELLETVAAGGGALAERVRDWLGEAPLQVERRPVRKLAAWMDGLEGLDMQWGEEAVPSEAGLEKTNTVNGQCVRTLPGGRKTVCTMLEVSLGRRRRVGSKSPSPPRRGPTRRRGVEGVRGGGEGDGAGLQRGRAVPGDDRAPSLYSRAVSFAFTPYAATAPAVV